MSGYQKSCLFCGEKIRLSNDIGNRWLPYNLDNSPHECREPTTTKKPQVKQEPIKITLTLESLDQRISKLEALFSKRLDKIENLLFAIE